MGPHSVQVNLMRQENRHSGALVCHLVPLIKASRRKHRAGFRTAHPCCSSQGLRTTMCSGGSVVRLCSAHSPAPGTSEFDSTRRIRAVLALVPPVARGEKGCAHSNLVTSGPTGKFAAAVHHSLVLQHYDGVRTCGWAAAAVRCRTDRLFFLYSVVFANVTHILMPA